MVGTARGGAPRRRLGVGKVAAVALKLVVTGVCLWYVSRHIDFAQIARGAIAINTGWASLAVVAIMAQIPLLALRWCEIVDGLSERGERISRGKMVAISAISIFLGQIMPFAVGDTSRVWMLTKLGRDWRLSLVSVLVDRAMGVATLVAIGFVVLLFPSALNALGGYHEVVLEFFGVLLVAIMIGLFAVPYVAPILVTWRFARGISKLACSAHDVLLRSHRGGTITSLAAGIHVLTILSVWCTGRALGLSFPVIDAAVLFTLIVAVSLIPVSIGGWGVREVSVVALLTAHGLSPEKALFFSVCFGLVLIVACLPGAFVWAIYSPARARLA